MDVPYAYTVESDVPIALQHSRPGASSHVERADPFPIWSGPWGGAGAAR